LILKNDHRYCLAGIEITRAMIGLYHYYKIYRAGVRAKVLLLSAQETTDNDRSLQAAGRYFRLLESYL